MKILTGSQMKRFDQRAIEHFGIPSSVLMENAGRSIAEALVSHVGEIEDCSVLILCGKGHNGGDGLCAARHLLNMGVDVEVAFIGKLEDACDETSKQIIMLQGYDNEIFEASSEALIDELQALINHADIVVDALLGIGVAGPVRGLYLPVIESLNDCNAMICALDIPSGVDADTGAIEGLAVQADITFTIELPKLGLLLHPGSEHAGDVLAVPIGYPDRLIEEFESKSELVEEIWLPPREQQSHKGTFGRVLIIGGSSGMSGAALMAAEASLRSGAGLVHVGFPQSLSPVFETAIWEAIKHPLSEESGALCEAAIDEILRIIDEQKIDVMALGPGLSQNKTAQELVIQLIEKVAIPMVIDADGLNALSQTQSVDMLAKMSMPPVLTPHPGELSRLMSCSIEEIEADRVGKARQFAKEQNVTLVLKGVPTITALPDGSIFVNSTGNSGLATGGSGDVLTGLIAGMMAHGLENAHAAVTGVYLHGQVADNLVEKTGERAMLPRDLLQELPNVLKDYE